VDTIFLSAAQNAPHVNFNPEKKFYEININATEKIFKTASAFEVFQIVFTSTKALYGYASQGNEKAVWVNKQTILEPRTIYHKTKIEAKKLLKEYPYEILAIHLIEMSR